MSSVRGQAGFTLIEVLMAGVLMLVVVGATLTSFNHFELTTNRNARQNDTQERARSSIIGLARHLRNLAGPAEGQPQAFDKVSAFDIVFKSVNPQGPAGGQNYTNVQRVRYCLDAAGKMWTQTQTWTTEQPPAAPSTAACPDGGWGNQRLVAASIVNGTGRSAFLFDSTDPAAVTQVRASLYVDTEPNRSPGETHLESGVFLRNQNRLPSASFQWSQGNTGHVILNASGSTDPEGQVLKYTWKDEGGNKRGDTVVFDWATTSGAHTVTLEVRDPAGLVATQTQAVTVP
jgi:type II secretory pathway component PulJ